MTPAIVEPKPGAMTRAAGTTAQAAAGHCAACRRVHRPGQVGRPGGAVVDKTVAPAGSPFAGMALARPLWPHQEKALAAFEEGRSRRAAATYLVVPPGGGKAASLSRAVRAYGRSKQPAL